MGSPGIWLPSTQYLQGGCLQEKGCSTDSQGFHFADLVPCLEIEIEKEKVDVCTDVENNGSACWKGGSVAKSTGCSSRRL